jgi:hypothetical protein
MKRKPYFLITFMVILSTYSVFCFGQETNITATNAEKNKKISYSFITEHGVDLGGDIGYVGVFVNGIRLNKTQDEIGIGVGFEYGIMGVVGIPIFANYRHYFSSKTNLKMFLNVAAGPRLCFFVGTFTPELYSSITTGFRVKVFSFSSGFYVQSFNKDLFGGIEIKLGCTFNTNKK